MRPWKTSRTKTSGLALAFFFFLCTSAAPVFAADELLADPSAACGFSGVNVLTLQAGDPFPIPNGYGNLTSISWTFYVIEISNSPFRLPGDILAAVLGRNLVLPPNTVFIRPRLAYTLPLGTPTGTARVEYMVFANHISTGGSIIRHLARCEYLLTVVP